MISSMLAAARPRVRTGLFLRFVQVLEVAGGLAFAGALTLAADAHSDGSYEISIYESYPILLWAFLVFAFTAGLGTALIRIFIGSHTRAVWYGLFLSAGVSSLLLLFPLLRDYAFVNQWDSVNHFAYTETILEQGFGQTEIFYPALHALAAAFSSMAGVDPKITLLLFPLLFYWMYLGNTAFLLSGLGQGTYEGVGLGLAAAIPLVFSTFGPIFRPVQFTVYLVPLALALIIQARSSESGSKDTIPIILLLLFAAFLHPLAVLAIAFLLLLLHIALGRDWFHDHHLKRRGFLGLALLALISWLIWFMHFQVFGVTIKRLVNAIVSGAGGERSFDTFVDAAQRAGISGSRILSLIVFTYCPTIIYLLLVYGLVTVYLASSRKKRVSLVVPVGMIFGIGFILLGFVSLFRDLVTGSPLRYTGFAVALGPLILVIVLQSIFRERKHANGLRGAVFAGTAILLLVSGSLGLFSTYFSPLNGQPNQQYSYSQLAGTEFFVERADEAGGNLFTPFRGSFTLSAVQPNLNLADESSSSLWRPGLAPAHFGYGADNEETFVNPAYLWVTAYEEAYYTKLWTSGGRFNPADFRALDADSDWHKVYSSGDLTIWAKRGQ